ncbi:MAG: alkaline phosphatase D family protein, partial [Erythrobacter sp.]|nr:alkaline phosphatase D family protein [Erythrobacter sp.]
MSGSDLITTDTLDFEHAPNHPVTIEADNGVDPVLSRSFLISVTNTFEQPDLSSLSIASPISRGTAVAITGATEGSTLAGAILPQGWALDGANREVLIASDAALGPQNWTLIETLADSANSPNASSGSSVVEGDALPTYPPAPTTNAFAESPIAGMRVFSDAISQTVFGLDRGVTESGDGVVQLSANPAPNSPRGQLIECSTSSAAGHAFHAEKLRFAPHDSLMALNSFTPASFADTSMASGFWQCELVPVAGEAKLFASFADPDQSVEEFYIGIADQGDGSFRFVQNGAIASGVHSFGQMIKLRMSWDADGNFGLESNSGGGWTTELTRTQTAPTPVTSIRWGCFAATRPSDFRFSATAISDTGFGEMDRDFFDCGSGTRDIANTSAAPVLFIPDGMFAGQAQARVRYAAGSDPTGGTPTAWETLGNRRQNTLALPITGLSANTRYTFQFEVGDSSGNVIWVSEAYSFKTLQTLGLPAAGAFNFCSCYAQVPFAHPYRDEQFTLDSIGDDYLGTFHFGDIGYEAGATANIATYMLGDPPVTPDGFERKLRDYFSDFDMERLQRAGPYIVTGDDHEAINNLDLSARGSTVRAMDFAPNKTQAPGWGTTTLGELWTAGLSTLEDWFYRHWFDRPTNEANGEPARYRKLAHGETEVIQLDTRWTRLESANRAVSIQQKAWIEAQIQALQPSTKLVLIIAQTGFSAFTNKLGDTWEGIAKAQYDQIVDFVSANMPAGCKALFVAGDDHLGFLFNDQVTTTSNPSQPQNIIGELYA